MRKAKTPDEVLAQQVKAIREERHWTQQQVTERLNRLGERTDRSAVARIETGTKRRRVTVGELLKLAAALGVSPTHLMVPFDENQHIRIFPKLIVMPGEARAWIRGQEALDHKNPEPYWTIVPRREREALEDWLFRALYEHIIPAVFGGFPVKDLRHLLEAALSSEDPIGAVLERIDKLDELYDRRIQELEKENARLKAEMESLRSKKGGRKR